MKAKGDIYSFKSEPYDLWHYKITEEPVNKEDCISAEEFSEKINVPFEVYEKYISAIEVEKRVAYISVESPTEDVPDSGGLEEVLSEFITDVSFKTFFGEYNEEMKYEVRKYISDMGYTDLRREEFYSTEPRPGYRYLPYSCNFFRREHTLGFYVSRQGLLRNCCTVDYSESTTVFEKIGGLRRDFELIEENLDKDYIVYMYGAAGWERCLQYYREHFLNNFEYGTSILYLDAS